MTLPCSDWIHLTEASFSCIVGLLEWERLTPQPLAVEVSMNVNLEEAAGGDLTCSINYATTLEQVEFIAQEGQWALLESLGTAIARLLLAPPATGELRAGVSEAIVRLRKPEVLSGRAVPSVELRRTSSWLTLLERASGLPGVAIEVLQEAREAGAYRIHLQPLVEWAVPANMVCMLIAGEVVTPTGRHVAGNILRADFGPLKATTATCFLGISRETASGRTASGRTGSAENELNGLVAIGRRPTRAHSSVQALLAEEGT